MDGLIYDVVMTKQALANAMGLPSSVLHVPVGLMLFSGFCLAFRGRARGMLWALVCVLALQVANEGLDAVQWVRWTGVINWHEAFGDVVLTMAAPVLVVLVRVFWGGRPDPERDV